MSSRKSPPNKMSPTKFQKIMGFKDLGGVLSLVIISAILGGVAMGIFNSGIIQKQKLTYPRSFEGSSGEGPEVIYGLDIGSMVAFTIAFIWWAGRSISLGAYKQPEAASYFIFGFFGFIILFPVIYIIIDLIVTASFPYCNTYENTKYQCAT